MEKAIIRQSNELIDALYKFKSIGEARLVYALLMSISPYDEDFKTYRIDIASLAELYELDPRNGRFYQQVDEAAKSLASTSITFRDGKSWLHTSWLSSAEYKHGSGYIELCFDAKLKPHLLNLKKYTEIKLFREGANRLKGTYSLRLFEILKKASYQHDSEGIFSRTFDYEELRKYLGVHEGKYPFFKDFRVNVLDKAREEITEKTSMKILECKEIRTGRRVSHIEIVAQDLARIYPDGPIPLSAYGKVLALDDGKKEEEKEKVDPEDVRAMCAMGISRETALKWRKKFGVKRVMRAIGYTKAMQKEKKIHTSLSGFLATAIQEGLGGEWEEEENRRKNEKKAREEAEQQTKLEAARVLAERERKKAELKLAFLALTLDEQAKIRDEYELQLQERPAALGLWNKAKIKHKGSPEDAPGIAPDFYFFLSNRIKSK